MKFHIAMGFDDVFAPYAAVTILSVLRNTLTPKVIVFHILHFSLSDTAQGRIQRMIRSYNAEVVFHTIPATSISGFIVQKHLTQHTYLRVFLPQVLSSDIAQVLYLDTDIMVLSDVMRVFKNITLGSYALAAVRDVAMFQTAPESCIRKGMYFNAGVMYINLDEWRKYDLPTLFKQELTLEDVNGDQDVLNRIFTNKWLPLPQRYQYIYYLRHAPGSDLKARAYFGWFKYHMMKCFPVMVHFCGPNKPWSHYIFSPYFAIYRKMIFKTAWKDEVGVPHPVRDYVYRTYFPVLKKMYWTILPHSLRTRIRLGKYFRD